MSESGTMPAYLHGQTKLKALECRTQNEVLMGAARLAHGEHILGHGEVQVGSFL